MSELPKWLLTEDNYWNDNYWWMAEGLFADNGITCESSAFWDFYYERWEDEIYIICPFCQSKGRHYEFKKLKRWKCKKCRKQFSLSSRTSLDNTKIPLTHWWRLAYLLGSGLMVTSHWLSKDLKLTQKTTWYMLKTIAEVMGAEKFSTPFKLHYVYGVHKVIKKLMKLKYPIKLLDLQK